MYMCVRVRMCACERACRCFFRGFKLEGDIPGGRGDPTVSGTQEKPYKFQIHLRNIGNLIRAKRLIFYFYLN